MKGLLMKDICILNTQRRFFIIVAVMGIVLIFTGQSIEFIAGYLMMVFGIFAGTTITYDENDHGMRFLMTLPVSRKQYVRSKYLFLCLMILAALMISLVFGTAADIINSQTTDFWELAGKAILMAAVMLAFNGAFLALIIRFGADKARMVMFVVFAGIVFFIWAADLINDEEKLLIPLHMGNLSDGMAVLLCCVASAVIVLVSYTLSVRCIAKKEY